MGRQRTRMEVWLGCGVILLAVIVAALTVTVIILATKKNDELPTAPTDATSSGEASSTPTTTTSSFAPPVDPYQQQYGDGLYNTTLRQNLEQQANISAQLLAEFNPMNIRDNLRWLTKTLHVAGTPENADVMHQLAAQYKTYGLDVKIHEYQVLLSYPNYSKPNTVEVQLTGQNNWNLVSNGTAQLLGPPEAIAQENDPRALVWWNGYAKDGVAVGPLIYVNYGSIDDYTLLDRHNINLQGAIVIARYGDIFRGAIAFEAEKRGAVGVIIFNDPFDYANHLPADETFPNTIWLPPSGAQRGTLLQTDGDPLTPFYPAKPYTYRTTDEATLRQQHSMPNVPVTPIGYRDALTIFQNMNGPEVTGDFASWKGDMNVVYRMNSGTSNFRLTVNAFTDKRSIYDVVALFYGADEPDKWVMFGNHVDAWTFGSIDPNSGTATMLEMARVVSAVSQRTGWRPKRTLAFCQWDAEEYGLVGSTEYVEEQLKPLEKRAVAMLNVDNINGNVTLAAKGVPLLYRALVDAAGKVPTPNPKEFANNRTTLLESWKLYDPRGPLPGDKSVPGISLPGSGSDFQRFISYVGVPVLDLKIVCAPVDCYTLYHSMYEVSWMVETLLDQNLRSFTAMGQLWLELGRNLADSLIIPFNVHDYGTMMEVYVKDLDKALLKIGFDKAIDDYNASMSNLRDSVKRFQAASDVLQGYVDIANSGVPITLRQVQMLNNRLTQVEQAFVNEFGLYPERAIARHVVFAKSIHDDYAGVTFSGILDPAAEWLAASTNDPTNAPYWATTTRYGVLFALKVLCNHYFPHSDDRILGWLPIPSRYACWAELLLIQLISPGASFIGHLAGILVGIAYTKGPLKPLMDILAATLQINDEVQEPRYGRQSTSSSTSRNQSLFSRIWDFMWGGGSSEEYRPNRTTQSGGARRDYGWSSPPAHDQTASTSGNRSRLSRIWSVIWDYMWSGENSEQHHPNRNTQRGGARQDYGRSPPPTHDYTASSSGTQSLLSRIWDMMWSGDSSEEHHPNRNTQRGGARQDYGRSPPPTHDHTASPSGTQSLLSRIWDMMRNVDSSEEHRPNRDTQHGGARRDYGWDSPPVHDYSAGLSEEEQMRQAMEDSLRSQRRYETRSYQPPYPSAPPMYPDLDD